MKINPFILGAIFGTSWAHSFQAIHNEDILLAVVTGIIAVVSLLYASQKYKK